MKRAMLITVSGIVGAGKSTALQQILEIAGRQGVQAAPWRFQRLPFIALRRGQREVVKTKIRSGSASVTRGSGYRRRRMTVATMVGYAARTVAFRVYLLFHRDADLYVVDRYFYDSFAHYELSSGVGRLYSAILARLVPRPDLAFVLVASPQTIAARRPQYTPEYVAHLGENYRKLQRHFPELIEVNTEPNQNGWQQIEIRIREKLGV